MTTVFPIVICTKILCYFVVFFTTTRPWFFDFWYKMYQNSTFRCIFNNKNARITYLSISPFQKDKISRFKNHSAKNSNFHDRYYFSFFNAHTKIHLRVLIAHTKFVQTRKNVLCPHFKKLKKSKTHIIPISRHQSQTFIGI